jgi:hypothetical protein
MNELLSNKVYQVIDINTLKTKKFNKFTIPEIKYSLIYYEIKFKSNVRKQDLYNILTRHVLSKDIGEQSVENNEKVIKIQKNVRKWLIKNKVEKHGIGIYNLEKCNNFEEPFTLNELGDVSKNDIITYFDKEDKKYYWFEILNLYDLFTTEKVFENPLNRKEFNKDFVDRFINNCDNRRNYMKNNIQSISNIISRDNDNILKIRMRAFDLFHNMHIVSGIPNLESSFYLELKPYELNKLYDGLQDLWNYRILLDVPDTKAFHEKYVPSSVNLFSRNKCIDVSKYSSMANESVLNVSIDKKCQNLLKLHDIILTDLENFFKYPEEDDKITVIFWILTVLTEINLKSAEKLTQFLVL